MVAGRADMDGGVVFELVRAVEDAAPVVRAHHCKLFRNKGAVYMKYLYKKIASKWALTSLIAKFQKIQASLQH